MVRSNAPFTRSRQKLGIAGLGGQSGVGAHSLSALFYGDASFFPLSCFPFDRKKNLRKTMTQNYLYPPTEQYIFSGECSAALSVIHSWTCIPLTAPTFAMIRFISVIRYDQLYYIRLVRVRIVDRICLRKDIRRLV